ncbi:MAG: hypothetical protein H0T11_00830 [Chthoniobacterales bacterium]|nr:hypothetical protein [Chthoniobacterales bacterium]
MMIGGFTVGGAQLAKVILCGIGPSLTSVGVAGAANSTGVALLELYDFGQ